MKFQSYSQASKQIISLLTSDIMPLRSLSALQEDPQSPLSEILVRAPEKPEIHPPSPLCPDLSETRRSAECHRRVHMESQRLSPAVGGASYFRRCLPMKHLLSEGKETDKISRCCTRWWRLGEGCQRQQMSYGQSRRWKKPFHCPADGQDLPP
ncbi:uncharacterized protein J5F26_007416 isoform 1-T1 [Ciconia maguari]